jgi:diacylglycerol kinase
MSDELRVTERFSIVRRAKSFAHAGRGIAVLLKRTPNARLQLAALGIVVATGLHVRIGVYEWAFVVFAAGLVLAAEALNTAIEIYMDLTSPLIHPHARDAKDVAAGAVLIASITAALIGGIIFMPYFVKY